MSERTEERANFKPASALPLMSEDESNAWRPEIPGWSGDILPFYRAIALELPNPCTVVEVGSAHGRSAIFLASILIGLGHGSQSKIFMVDDWGGGWFAECLPSIVKNATPAELEMLRPLRTTSEVACEMFRSESIDMVFIDGDHSRVACAEDLRLWFYRAKDAGIVAGHDYDPVAHPGVVAAVDEFIERRKLDVKLERPTRSVWRLR